jgi:hypothetical protein
VETIFSNPKMVQEYGIMIILFCLFLFLFVRYIKASEKRFTKIETDLDIANLFIRNEMAEMIKQQQKVIIQNNNALLQHSKDYSRLCQIIGSLNGGRKNNEENNLNFENEFGNDTQEINYNQD